MSKHPNPKEFTCDAQKLRGELDNILDKKKSSGEASSALGQLRKSTAEKLDCHKDALGMIEKIYAMSEEKRSDVLRSFMPMYDALRPDWEQEISDMLTKADAQTSEMEKDMAK